MNGKRGWEEGGTLDYAVLCCFDGNLKQRLVEIERWIGCCGCVRGCAGVRNER